MRLAWGRYNAGCEAVFSASRSLPRLNWLPNDGWPAALPRDERRLLHRRNDDREAAREAPLRPRDSRRARICGMVAIQWARRPNNGTALYLKPTAIEWSACSR